MILLLFRPLSMRLQFAKHPACIQLAKPSCLEYLLASILQPRQPLAGILKLREVGVSVLTSFRWGRGA